MNKQMSIFLGIDHPAVAADDVELLSDWYCDVLGYTRFFRSPKPIWILKAPDNTYLEVMPKDEMPRPHRSVCTPGLSHLAIRVSDIHQAIEYLDKKQVTWCSDIVDAIGGGKLRSFFDPEGNMLQVVQR
jgi:glyoxylase I family protein